MRTVVVRDGKVVCISQAESCDGLDDGEEVVDLRDGSLAPGLTSFGSNLGLSEIAIESSTMDGPVFDPLTTQVPRILGHTVIRAVDGLQFGGRHALYVAIHFNSIWIDGLTLCRLAHQSGVTTGIKSQREGNSCAVFPLHLTWGLVAASTEELSCSQKQRFTSPSVPLWLRA